MIGVVRSVPVAHLVSLFQARNELTSSMTHTQENAEKFVDVDIDPSVAVAPDDLADKDKPLLAGHVSRSELFDRLHTQIEITTCVPASLALGHAKLHDKSAAILYSYYLEVGLENLQDFLESFRSYTTDFGVESLVPSFMPGSYDALLPPWMVRSRMAEDVTDYQDSSQPFLPNSLPTMGLLHVLSNVASDVHHKLQGWEQFHASLKEIERLLCHNLRLQRFIATCFHNPSPFAADVTKFKRKFHGLYNKRWVEVHSFCLRLVDVLPIMIEVWDAAKFAQSHSREDDFTADGITRTLNDKWFLSYLDMVLCLGEVVQSISLWAERCPLPRTSTRSLR